MFESKIRPLTDKINRLEAERQQVISQIMDCQDYYKNQLAGDHLHEILNLLSDCKTELKVWLNNEPEQKVRKQFITYLN